MVRRRVKRQLLYSFVYLSWTAILLAGVLYFAFLHVTIGGILTILWVLFLASLGIRVGRIGAKETVRQIYALGLPLTVLWMLTPIVAWRLCIRRISRSEAAEQTRFLFRQLKAVAMQELSAGGGQSTCAEAICLNLRCHGSGRRCSFSAFLYSSHRPFVSVALIVDLGGYVHSSAFLVLIGIHTGGGLVGWLWLFLGAGLWYFWYYAGRRGFGAAVTGVMAMLIGFFRMIGSIFSSSESREGRRR